MELSSDYFFNWR